MANSSKERLKRTLPRLIPWLLGGLVLYWYLPTWVWHIRRTWDPYAFNDDARILIWPFLREANRHLFPNDPFIPYYLAGLPEGYLALYRIVSHLGWTKETSEVLQYVSVLSVAAILGATARRLAGTVAAFLACVLVLGSESFFDRAGGGLPRAFAFPLVSAGLYALVTDKPRLLAALVIAGAAFYPVVAALLGIGLFLLLVLPARCRRGRGEASDPDTSPAAVPCSSVRARIAVPFSSVRARIAGLGATLLCVVVLVIPMSLRLHAYGAPITPAMLADFPEAGPFGRLTPEQRPPFEAFTTVLARHSRSALVGQGEPISERAAAWLRGNNQRTSLVVGLVITAAAARLLASARRRPNLVRPWLLLLAALIGHGLACLVAPRLFLPERYVQYGVPPLVVLVVACGCGGSLTVGTAGGKQRSWHFAAAALLLLLIGARGASWVGVEVYVPPSERLLYAEIARLPSQSLVAGWPAGPLENVPYLSERRVLTNFQLEMPFHVEFTLESRRRLRALFEAHFAIDPQPIERLCSEFDVTHFLIDPAHYTKARPDYYAPHRAELALLLTRTEPADAALLRFRSHPSTRHFDGGLDLIDLSQIPELTPACSDRQAP